MADLKWRLTERELPKQGTQRVLVRYRSGHIGVRPVWALEFSEYAEHWLYLEEIETAFYAEPTKRNEKH